MFCFVSRFAVLLVVLVGALAPAAAEERQFTASGVGSVSDGSFQGMGESTHLGRAFLNMSGYTDFLGSGYFAPFGGSLESSSRDFLDFVFDEEAYYFDPATGVLFATVTITAGPGRTGRFENATGSADLMIIFDPSYYSFDFLIVGSIDY